MGVWLCEGMGGVKVWGRRAKQMHLPVSKWGGCEALAELIRWRPLCFVCVSFLMGSALSLVTGTGSDALSGASTRWFCVLCALALAAPAIVLLQASLVNRAVWICSAVFAVFLGFLRGMAFLAVSPDDASHFTSPHLVQLLVEIEREPRIAPLGTSTIVRCEWMQIRSEARPLAGRSFLEIGRGVVRGPISAGLAPGDVLCIMGVLQPLSALPDPIARSLKSRGIHSAIHVSRGGSVTVLACPSPWNHLCRAVRDWFREGIRHRLPDRKFHVLDGMLFHESAEISPGITDDLQKTGTIHVIATAGLHVAIFLGVCLWSLCAVLPRRGAVILAGILLFGYCVACGCWPAVLRACIVAELCLLAWLLQRIPDPATCLALVAAGVALLNPNDLCDPGFHLTFATVAVILLAAPASEKDEEHGRLKQLTEHGMGIARLSIAAQLGSWPLTALNFGVISYVGVVANLLIVPLLIVGIPLGLVVGGADHVCSMLAGFLAPVLDAILSLMLNIAHRFALQPWAWEYVDPPPIGAVVGYYAIVFAGLGWMRCRGGQRD